MSTKQGFIEHLQGLRGLAIILVFLFHADGNLWPSGYLGVDIFLVITGYLLFHSRLKRNEPESLKDFFNFIIKRVNRIIPPMVITILGTTIIGVFLLWWHDELFLCKLGYNACLAKANIFLKKQFEDYFAQDSAFIPLLHLWYLSVTLQIYLIWAVGNYMLQRLPKRGTICFLFLLGFTSLGYCYSFPLHEKLKEMGIDIWLQTDKVSYYETLPRLWEVLAGGLIFILPPVKNRFWGSILSGIGLLNILYFAFLENVLRGGGELPATFIVVISTVLIIRYIPQSYINTVLSNKLLVRLGDISFSLYLVHMPLIIYWRMWLYGKTCLFDIVYMLLVSCLLGTIFWKFIEKKRFTWIGIILLYGATMGFCILGRHTEGFKKYICSYKFITPIYEKWKLCQDESYYQGLDKKMGSFDKLSEFIKLPSDLASSKTAKLFTIGNGDAPYFVLIGDSHAAHTYPGLDHISKYSRKVKMSGLYLSSYIVPLHNEKRWLVPKTEIPLMLWLQKHPELSHVIIAQFWRCRPEDKATIREEELRQFIKQIVDMNKKVIIIAPTPEFTIGPSMQHYCKILLLRNGDAKDVAPVSNMKNYHEVNKVILPWLEKLEQEGLCTIIASDKVFPKDEVIYSAKGNTVLMKDKHHMYSPQSIFVMDRLLPQFQKALFRKDHINKSPK